MSNLYCVQVDPAIQSFRMGDFEWDEIVQEGVYMCGNAQLNSHIDPELSELFDTYCVPDNLSRALSRKNGMRYAWAEIHGSCQSEWQVVYYPETMGTKWLKRLEAEYFNTGSEWFCFEDEADAQRYMRDGDQVWKAQDIYCVSFDPASEIAAEFGVGEVELWEFDGYTKAPKYKAV